ncbi:MAG TPA: LuxR C-terminal-related transcriptional regulator [Anaerolineae bacterium]|nr:LuxR C-terminal-related transcriptional regulator [Anaerolineae bacterium]
MSLTPALLTTKLAIPPTRPDLVTRPRLIERLHQARHYKLTLVSAAAGFGKTTLLSMWSQLTPLPVAWVSLDADDNDPARFLAYLIAALRTIHTSIGDAAQELLHSPQLLLQAVVATLINEIAAGRDDFVLVLDDYQSCDDPGIHWTVAFLLDHMPAHMHLVIASRSDPPLPLPRLRARREMLELQTDDLRFTPEETTAFLTRVMGLELSAQDIAALDAHTEGWIAALQLAVLSMQGLSDTAGFIATFTGSHRHIMDYLVEEVVSRQPPDVQSFLLRTAVLDRLCGSLCDAVTGRDDGPAILDQLERANLFLVRLDEGQHWYRYHHLFADALRARLHQTQPSVVGELHRRAAEWHERNGSVETAIGHALAGQDFETAARLIECIVQVKCARGELATSARWLNALPDEFVRARPLLAMYQAQTLLYDGHPDRAEQLLQNAERILQDEAPADHREHMSGRLTALRAVIACVQGRITESLDLARQALERVPAHDAATRGRAVNIMGIALSLQGDVAESGRAFAQALHLGQTTGHIYLTLTAFSNLADAYHMQGRLRQAVETCDRALGFLSERSWQRIPAASAVYLKLADLDYEWNKLDAAERHLTTCLELAEQGGIADVLLNATLTRASLKQAQGDRDDAIAAIQRANELAQRYNPSFTLMAPRLARIWLSLGDIDTAAGTAQTALQQPGSETPDYSREFVDLALARVHLAQDAPDAALQRLERWLEPAESAGRAGSVIEIHLLKALALETQGDTPQALAALHAALSLAEPEGYTRLFLDEGAPMDALLSKATECGAASGYASRLLAAFASHRRPATHAHTLGDTLPVPGSYTLIEPLNDRELQVLSLIADGLSNKEIAREKAYTLSTVKWYVRNIYEKLQVHSRTQAIARARAVGLLG